MGAGKQKSLAEDSVSEVTRQDSGYEDISGDVAGKQKSLSAVSTKEITRTDVDFENLDNNVSTTRQQFSPTKATENEKQAESSELIPGSSWVEVPPLPPVQST